MLYFSFEDERLGGMESSDLDIVVEEFYRLHPQLRDQERVVLFFDEIQVVPGWELFIRRLLDTENAEIFISGSSARLLSREVATSMKRSCHGSSCLSVQFQGVSPPQQG